MQGNSNQQTFSVSIRSKREQFRAEIRRQQLQAYFRAKRIEHFSNQKPKHNIEFFKDLETRIKLGPPDSESLQNIQIEVKKLFDSDPEEQFNFYALANLLLKRPQKFHDFKDFIIHQDNLIFHSTGTFAWCFGIYFAYWYSEIELNNLQENFASEIGRMDMFLAAVIEALYNNQNFKIDQETLYCLEIYVVAFKNILVLMKDQDFFPIFSFNAFIFRLQDVYKKITNQKAIFARDLKIKVTELVNEITKNIEYRKIYISQKPELQTKMPSHLNPDYIVKFKAIEELMKAASQICYQNFKDASDERNQCYKSILILSKWSAIIAGEFLFNEKIIKELIFNMINQKVQISIDIMKSFSYVIPGLSNTKWNEMLQQSLHVNLVTLLRNSLDEIHGSKEQEKRYSESLYQVLWLIQLILHKSREMEVSLYGRIFYQMESYGFGDLIDSMNHHRYDKPIEDIWSVILNKNFSSDMEEEYQLNIENVGDHMNVEMNGGMNEKLGYQRQNVVHYQQEYEI